MAWCVVMSLRMLRTDRPGVTCRNVMAPGKRCRCVSAGGRWRAHMLRAIQSERDAAGDIDCVERAPGRRESEAHRAYSRLLGAGSAYRQYAGRPQSCAKARGGGKPCPRGLDRRPAPLRPPPGDVRGTRCPVVRHRSTKDRRLVRGPQPAPRPAGDDGLYEQLTQAAMICPDRIGPAELRMDLKQSVARLAPPASTNLWPCATSMAWTARP